MASVRPKKHLGQHFLKDENIAMKIVEALQYKGDGLVIEIGPGTGVLTKHLLERDFKHFVAHDVDEESVNYLKDQYPFHNTKFQLVDFLKFNIPDTPISIIGLSHIHI